MIHTLSRAWVRVPFLGEARQNLRAVCRDASTEVHTHKPNRLQQQLPPRHKFRPTATPTNTKPTRHPATSHSKHPRDNQASPLKSLKQKATRQPTTKHNRRPTTTPASKPQLGNLSPDALRSTRSRTTHANVLAGLTTPCDMVSFI